MSYRLLLLGCMVLLLACNLTTLTSEDTDDDNTAADTQSWVSVAIGVDYQVKTVQPGGAPSFDMHILRLDPTQLRFDVQNLAGNALTFSQWRAQLSDAVVFVNGSFFDANDQAIGLVVDNRIAVGQTLDGFGGMFQVDTSGNVRVRSLVQEPYQPNEAALLQEALQAFPMLVEPGGLAANKGDGFDAFSRRTVIAQDTSGHILLMATDGINGISFSLLIDWLVASDLNIDVAFNLDGGRSTMLYATGNETISIPSFSAVPVVLAVYPR